MTEHILKMWIVNGLMDEMCLASDELRTVECNASLMNAILMLEKS